MVVIVRIVLESIDFIAETILESLSEIDIRTVGIERTIRIRSIQEPVPAFLVGDNIDDPANGIRSKAYGNYPFIYLYTVSEVHRDIVQAEGAPDSFLRHPVNEYLDVLSAEAVQHELHVRTYPTRLTKLHARSLGQGIAQILRGVLQFLSIDRHRIERRPFHPAHSGRNDGHLIQLLRLGSNGDILLHPLTFNQLYLLFYFRIAYGRYNQRIITGRRLDVIEAFLIGGSSITCPFQIHGCKIYSFFFRGKDSARNHPSPSLRIDRERHLQKNEQKRKSKCICFQFYNDYDVVNKPVQRSILATIRTIAYCR